MTEDQLSSFPSTVVKCMMEAMRDGSSEARERFPRLLQVIENHPDTMDLFIDKVCSCCLLDLMEVIRFMRLRLVHSELKLVHSQLCD